VGSIGHAHGQRMVLGQIATDVKSNEITAVPKLLKMLSLKGTIVTVDALNCQRAEDTDTTVETGNGRIETRTATLTTDAGWLRHDHEWPGLVCIGKITRTRETAGKTERETAYHLLS
jgi:predicted transposase YbfD/YdcC